MRLIDGDIVFKKLAEMRKEARYGIAEEAFYETMRIIDDTPTISEEANTKAAAIMQHYGAEHQLMKLCEECGELIQQAAKCYDKNIPYSEDFIEELADVSVMIEQFKSIFCAAHYELYQKIIQEKLDRQIRRIDDEGQGGESY